ncbi:hypothetical protein GGR57DRAFT_476676 [Xylariaceae sp. FL1272]|nr:hypothetical protein GGR57DRAFT_476676 [Xylariaceae sp. FL1272]
MRLPLTTPVIYREHDASIGRPRGGAKGSRGTCITQAKISKSNTSREGRSGHPPASRTQNQLSEISTFSIRGVGTRKLRNARKRWRGAAGRGSTRSDQIAIVEHALLYSPGEGDERSVLQDHRDDRAVIFVAPILSVWCNEARDARLRGDGIRRRHSRDQSIIDERNRASHKRPPVGARFDDKRIRERQRRRSVEYAVADGRGPITRGRRGELFYAVLGHEGERGKRPKGAQSLNRLIP